MWFSLYIAMGTVVALLSTALFITGDKVDGDYDRRNAIIYTFPEILAGVLWPASLLVFGLGWFADYCSERFLKRD